MQRFEKTGEPLALNFHRESRSIDLAELSARSVLHKIVAENFNFLKMYSQWFSKLLTENHKKKRLECVLDFPSQYDNEGDEMLSRIVTGDENRISHISTSESKQKSMEWRHLASTVLIKAKQMLSQLKITATVFCHRRGILLVEFMPRAETINAAVY